MYSVENATNRRDTVLNNMVAAGYIDKATADQAAANGLGSQLVDAYAGKSEDYRYPSYFDAVINEAIHDYGLKEEDIIKNGYRIYTELDQNYQASMQVIYSNESLFPVSDVYKRQTEPPSSRASTRIVKASTKCISIILMARASVDM